MSIKRQLRWPGDPSGGDATFGPLVGLPDEVYFFVKDRQRRRDADANRLAEATSRIRPDGIRAGYIGLAGRMRRLGARLRLRIESSNVRR